MPILMIVPDCHTPHFLMNQIGRARDHLQLEWRCQYLQDLHQSVSPAARGGVGNRQRGTTGRDLYKQPQITVPYHPPPDLLYTLLPSVLITAGSTKH